MEFPDCDVGQLAGSIRYAISVSQLNDSVDCTIVPMGSEGFSKSCSRS